MKTIVCSSCGRINFVLRSRCKNCGNIIREKFNSINLGELIYYLLIEPQMAARQVFYSTKKNYLFVLLFLFAMKSSIYTFYDGNIIDTALNFNFNNLFLVVLNWIVVILGASIFFKIVIELISKEKIAFKDILSLTTYPFLYYSLSLFILFPLELMLFGKYLFSNNPDIFSIDLFKALSVVIFELMILIYSVYLLFSFLNFIIDNKFISLLMSLVYFSLLFLGNKLIINLGMV